jgi:hypothetical protein
MLNLETLFLEVVSKPQIRFNGPAKRDYISDLKKLLYASSVRPIGKAQSRQRRDEQVHLPEACDAP